MGDLERQSADEFRILRQQILALRLEMRAWRFATVLFAVLCLISWCVTAFGADRIATPSDAVSWALRDARNNAGQAHHFFYLFTLYPSDEEIGGASYGLNTIHSTNRDPLLLCAPIDARRQVYRVDERVLNPQIENRIRMRLILEAFASFNFYFHSIDPEFATADGVAIASGVDSKHAILRDFPEYKHNGKTFTKRHFAAFVPAVHLAGMAEDYDEYLELCELTQRDNPIMRLGQFFSLSMRTTGGGFYYELAGIPNTSAEFDKLVGADHVKSEDLESDKRSVMWSRTLNGHPSGFEWVPTLGANYVLGGLKIRTLDYVRRGSDFRVHPIQNILDRTHVAEEVFATKPNGHLYFFLANAQGERQDVAPGNVAVDTSTHPASEIESCHSCLRCHGPVGMYHPISNSLLTMLEFDSPVKGWKELPLQEKFRRLKVVEDFGQKGDLVDILDRASGLYSGDPSEVVALARFNHARAAQDSTGGVFGLNHVEKATAKLCEIYDRYELELISPQLACRELGIATESDAEAQVILRQIGGKLYPNSFGFSPETPVLWALMAWKPGTRDLPKRQDWENEYAVLMTRVNNLFRSGELEL